MEENSTSNKSLEDKLPYIEENGSSSYTIPDSDKNLAKKEEDSYSKKKANVISEQGLELHKILFRIALNFIRVLSTLFILLLIIWFLHLILPECLKWLNDKDLQTIERILFASTILSFAGKYFAKFKLLDRS